MPERKIIGYLLNFSHTEGVNKAFFFVRFGFLPSEWEILSKALLQHATENFITQKIRTAFGEKYLINGPIKSPDGRNPEIITVWFKENNEDIIKLITAYPAKL
ncbi:MAG: hypothetical protein HY738_10920 [Bacteroidia bacterium]|nr:hypothetical protein [Bacteroidia bacterium]